MNRHTVLDRVLGASWSEVLERIDDAVLVLDSQRTLSFVNEPARRLLGYDRDEVVGGRCRLTTRGVDCESACPLTFALEGREDRVEDFATVYTARDGRAVPLRVTVIPIRDDGGEFVGAVEILRPSDPDPGYFLRGTTPAVKALKARLLRHSRSRRHLVLVGERPVCLDVGRAVHRFSGLSDELFEVWTGSWSGTPSWPPGTMYADGDAVGSLVASDPPDGWQLLVGVPRGGERIAERLAAEIVELPPLERVVDDLALIAAAWAIQLAPGIEVSPEAAQRLARIAREGGFEVLQTVIVAAVAAAGPRLEEEHIPADGYACPLVDELLRADKPLAALERRLLTEVLIRSGWRMQEAADRLGVSRVTLWRKCKDHGIERPEGAAD